MSLSVAAAGAQGDRRGSEGEGRVPGVDGTFGHQTTGGVFSLLGKVHLGE